MGLSRPTPRIPGGIRVGALALILVSLGTGWAACSGGSGNETEETVTTDEEYPMALLERSWPIVMADTEARQPYEAAEGWVELVREQDLQAAVADLGPGGGIAAARAHAEAAAMFRQASMLYANAIVAAWGNMAEPTDPAEGAHLLMVAYVLNGDLVKAREQAALMDAVESPVSAAWHEPWKAWLAQESPQWPPDLSALPSNLGEPKAGEWPTGVKPPHYTLVERSEEKHDIEASDIGQLVALAIWHDAVARAAIDDPVLVDLFVAAYRMPIEGPFEVKEGVVVPMDLVFGSDHLVAEDANFIAALHGEQGAAAVDAWKGTSMIASLADRARTEGKIDPEKAIDLAAATRRVTLARMKEKAGGNTEGFHRTFADIARVAALRGLALVAEAEGDREVSGRLRILAWESSDQVWTADPSALLAFGAWDASNEYPVRPLDMLHNLIRTYPSLETARFGVERLGLRVSRRRGGGLPGQ